MERKDVDINKISPMMRQYLNTKEKYEDVILFYRIGDFYEMFFEDAIKVSRDLELTLTGKNAGLEEKIPMCGVPHHAANIYLEKLIEKGYKVAICEQVEDPKDAKGIVRRDVIRVVSKGTIMSDEMLDSKNNNYIGALVYLNYCYSLSYLDLTTGEFYTKIVSDDESVVINEILNCNITELVVSSDISINITEILQKQYLITISYEDEKKELHDYKKLYKKISDVRLIKSICVLLNYISKTQKRNIEHLQDVIVIENNNYLKMDIATKRSLELTSNLRLKDKTYSLLWLLDKTKTAMGSRMLKSMIENPLYNKTLINKRLDMVEKLSSEFLYKEELKTLLNNVYDLERLSGRISFGNANAKDLLQLKQSIKDLPRIKEIINILGFDLTIYDVNDLYNYLEKSIYENPPTSLKEGYLIKEGFSKDLDELKEFRYNGKNFIANLEEEERKRTNIKNLKVGYNKIFGYYIEVSKGNSKYVKEEFGYERKQTLANCERFVTPLLKEKEALVLGCEEKIISLEYELFIAIKNEVKKLIPLIQITAKSLALLDVMISFSNVSEENNYVRPIFTDKKIVKIKNSRHPVVEKVMKEEFTSNDILFDNNSYIKLITGPNMSGKSTYMRQFAIIIIMAQIGCFVPAESCTIPLFNKIFTRIGASDDLVSGESTFMVEMLEANKALSFADENSLILFDELGRGTATYDGMSLAYAIIEYIHDNIKCITLFSTHYHELTNITKEKKCVKNVYVSALEENEKIIFLHKVKDGISPKSYGVHVARLAKLPQKLIERAEEILEDFEGKNIAVKQISMNFNNEVVKNDNYDIIKKKFDNINPLEISPIEALNIIYEIKKEINKS